MTDEQFLTVINWCQLAKETAVATSELQKQFQSIVGKYDKMILTRSRETQELITLRDFLLPLLMMALLRYLRIIHMIF